MAGKSRSGRCWEPSLGVFAAVIKVRCAVVWLCCSTLNQMLRGVGVACVCFSSYWGYPDPLPPPLPLRLRL